MTLLQHHPQQPAVRGQIKPALHFNPLHLATVALLTADYTAALFLLSVPLGIILMSQYGAHYSGLVPAGASLVLGLGAALETDAALRRT
jgi:hypothetical protein